MSTSTSTSTTPINNIKNLVYNILKTFKDSIVKGIKITELEHCLKVEIIETNARRGSESSTSSVVRGMEKHSIQSQDMPEILEEDMPD
ncbi:3390_t:CDS:2, partial [Dentiscutata erythropus]